MPNANVNLAIGSARTVNDATNPLALDQKQLLQDFAVNTFSVVIAAELAVKGFAILPDIASKHLSSQAITLTRYHEHKYLDTL